MVLGGEDAVGEVALAGQVDVGELVLEVQVAFHLGLVVLCAAGLHYGYYYFNIYYFIQYCLLLTPPLPALLITLFNCVWHRSIVAAV